MQIINKIENYKYVVSSFLFIVLFSFPIMRNAVQSISLISFIVISIIFYYKDIRFKLKNISIWKRYLILTGFFWFSIISFFWTENKDLFINELQPTILIGVLPFVVLFIHPTIREKEKKYAYLLFIITLFVYLILWFEYHVEGISIYQEIILKESPIRDLSFTDQLKYLKNHSYQTWVGGVAERGQKLLGYNSFFKHSAYVSSYFLFGTVLSIYLFIKSNSLITRVFLAISTVTFLLFVVYLFSKINILLLSFFLFIAIFFLKKKQIIIIIILLITLGFLGKQRIINKIENIKSWEFFEKKDNNLDRNIVIDYKRAKIYECAILEISENYILGIGLGDVQKYYNNCLLKKGIDRSIEYNSHSQLLHFFLVGGILNVMFFIMAFMFLLIKSIKEKHILLFLFVLLIIANSIFENYLSRVYGVLFFTLFISLLPTWNINKK